jgi:hypothetical protein
LEVFVEFFMMMARRVFEVANFHFEMEALLRGGILQK